MREIIDLMFMTLIREVGRPVFAHVYKTNYLIT